MADGATTATTGRRLTPVVRQKLADLAYDAIRSSIVGGEFAMGERLVETRFAQELGVSRAPVREALRRLLEEGLVVERPHHGMFVRHFAAHELVDLYNVRLALETTALRLFVRRGSPTAPLRDEIDRRRASAHAGDIPGVVAADFAFHEEVVRGSQNAVLLNLFRNLAAQTLLALAAAADTAVAELADEHVPVVEALERGDECRVIEAFVAVVVATVERLVAPLGGDMSRLLVDPALY